MSSGLDTIFAPASGPGLGAITVLRISGPGTQALVQDLAPPLPAPRRASLRRLRDPATAEVLDHAMVLWLPGPGSYTGEDSAEFHLHGGAAVLAAVAAALRRAGARPAEPGEFTRRAVQQGKLDLVQAEAVADLVAAETEAQRRQALRQAEGGLSALYATWTSRAARLLAHQEAAIEFEMDDLPSDLGDRARAGAATLAEEIARHLDDGGRGERLRTGLSVVIAGPVNAGKSSLLNALLRSEAAIVSPRPGTTRDVVERRYDAGGIPVTLADTAGLRAAEDEIEAEGIRRTRHHAAEADILLLALPADQPPDPEALALAAAHAEALLVVTKADLAQPPALPSPALVTSTRTMQGLPSLREAIAAAAQRRAGLSAAPALTRARHRAALEDAMAALREAVDTPQAELVAENLRLAVGALGRLTGRVGVEEVLDLVFADFCIGK